MFMLFLVVIVALLQYRLAYSGDLFRWAFTTVRLFFEVGSQSRNSHLFFMRCVVVAVALLQYCEPYSGDLFLWALGAFRSMVLNQIFHICAVWGEPLSQTAQSFMPELLYGANRNLAKARDLLKSLLIIGASVGLVLGIIATSIPWLAPNVFTPDLVIIAEMHKVWIPFFLSLCITPCILSCEGTLLAGRDLKFISLSMSGCFTLGALVLLFVKSQGMGLVGCWTALVGFQWARFFLSLRRILSPDGVLFSEDLSRFKLAEVKAA